MHIQNHLYIISLWTCRRTYPALPLWPYLSRSSPLVLNFPAQSSGQALCQVRPFGQGTPEICAYPQLQLRAVGPYFRTAPSGGLHYHLLLLVAEHLKVQDWKILSHCRSVQTVHTKLAISSLQMLVSHVHKMLNKLSLFSTVVGRYDNCLNRFPWSNLPSRPSSVGRAQGS